MELIEQIKHSLLFSGLADNDLAELAAITAKRTFDNGEILFRQNDEATGFYLLVSGSIRLSNISAVNRKKTFNFVSPGETFAEAAFFSDRNYQCEAQALAGGEAIYFPKTGFHELIRRNPNPALNLLGHLSFIVRQLSRKFMERSQGDVASRIATFLVGRMAESTASCGKIYLELGIKKSELATRLGVAQETISRSFKKLKDEGILEVQKNRVVIYQLEKLKKLCEMGE
jgi:CRP/FNR family transcriptional regulator